MKRGREKKDRQGAHESDGLFSQTHLSFSFPRHTFTQCSNTGFIFFFSLPSLSLSVSSPRAIGPSVSRLHHIQSSHCVSLNECVCVCEGGGDTVHWTVVYICASLWSTRVCLPLLLLLRA